MKKFKNHQINQIFAKVLNSFDYWKNKILFCPLQNHEQKTFRNFFDLELHVIMDLLNLIMASKNFITTLPQNIIMT